MNSKTALILLFLLSATAHAVVSNESRAERERRIRSQLSRNAFVNSTGSQVQEVVSAPSDAPPVLASPVPAQEVFSPTGSGSGQGGGQGSGQGSGRQPSVQDTGGGSVGGAGSSGGQNNGSGGGGGDGTSNSKPQTTAASNDSRRKAQRLRKPDVQQRTVGAMLDLQDQIIERGGCNRNLCFTLDASNKLSKIDFLLQRDFVQLIAATLGVDNDVHVAAFQYGPSLQKISSLSPDIDSFLLRLEQWQRKDSRRRNFLAGAMWRCMREMRPRRTVDANKMVVIGNGRTSRFKRKFALQVSRIFRGQGRGAICAVAVDNSNRSFLGRLTGDPTRVLGVTDFSKFDTILRDIVRDICGLR